MGIILISCSISFSILLVLKFIYFIAFLCLSLSLAGKDTQQPLKTFPISLKSKV